MTIAELRALAEAAAPGECDEPEWVSANFLKRLCFCEPDTAYIAAASPDLILAMLDVRDAAVMLRQHLGLFCTPSDAIAKAVFDSADAAIAAVTEKIKHLP